MSYSELCSHLTYICYFNLQVPTTEAQWKKIAQRFEQSWKFPNCMHSMHRRRRWEARGHVRGNAHSMDKYMSDFVSVWMSCQSYNNVK